MSNLKSYKKPLYIIFNAVVVTAILLLAWQVHWLNKEQQFKQSQIELVTARLNNLKECYLRDDVECPEGKYSDSAEIIEKMKADAGK